MPWTELAVAAIGLGGVALGGFIARWNTSVDRKARIAVDSAAAARKSEEEAIIELLAATRLLSHRANGFRMTVKLVQSRGAKRDRRSGHMVPIDPEAAFERLVQADQVLARASGKVWLIGEPEAVRLTNALTLAASDVVSAHMGQRSRGLRRVLHDLQMQYTAKLPGVESRIDEANQAWGAAGRALAEYARRKYGLEYVNLSETQVLVGEAVD
ncbi:hypothetical protein GCM10027053_14830 [Intrasporangium mesophilum]